jgi:hypothetical protein
MVLPLQPVKKWLFFILLLITAAGTFIPCCSIDDCCADQVTKTTNHDKHTSEGTCSPFFACTTCPGFAETAVPVQLAEPVTEKTVYHQTIVKFNLPAYSSSFWQPPRSC